MNLLQRLPSTRVDLDQMPSYQRFALNYFHQVPKVLANPNFSVTVQFEITGALQNYREKYSETAGASFTAYLVWRLNQALQKNECFRFRYFQNEWRCFEDPPIFMPIATQVPNRFTEIILEKVGQMTWQEFAEEYRSKVEAAKQGNGLQTGAFSEDLYYLCTFIGNIPNLQFTSMVPQDFKIESGRPLFYFGHRYRAEKRDLIPLAISIHHGNTDLQVLNQLLESFSLLLLN